MKAKLEIVERKIRFNSLHYILPQIAIILIYNHQRPIYRSKDRGSISIVQYIVTWLLLWTKITLLIYLRVLMNGTGSLSIFMKGTGSWFRSLKFFSSRQILFRTQQIVFRQTKSCSCRRCRSCCCCCCRCWWCCGCCCCSQIISMTMIVCRNLMSHVRLNRSLTEKKQYNKIRYLWTNICESTKSYEIWKGFFFWAKNSFYFFSRYSFSIS